MEATFSVKREDLTLEWLEQLKSQFDKEDTIVITAISPDKPLSVEEQRVVTQRGMLERLQEIQKKYPPKEIAADIDINELIDELNWEGNH